MSNWRHRCAHPPRTSRLYQCLDSEARLGGIIKRMNSLGLFTYSKIHSSWCTVLFLSFPPSLLLYGHTVQGREQLQIQAASATYTTACSNTRSLTHGVRDWIHILMDTSQVCSHWATMGTPAGYILCSIYADVFINSFPFKCWIVFHYMDVPLCVFFIPHLGCFQFLMIIKKATTNISVQIGSFSFHLGKYPEVGLCKCMFNTKKLPICLPNWLHHFIFAPTMNIRGPQLLYILTHLVLFIFFSFF